MKSSKQIFTVAGYTFREAVRRRSFWITNIIYIVIILGACIILPRIGGDSAETPDASGGADLSAECLIINESEALAGADALLQDIFPGSQSYAPNQRSECMDRLMDEGTRALVEISADDPPQVTITTRDAMSSFPVSFVWETLSSQYQTHLFGKLGYDQAEAAGVLQSALPLQTELADTQSMSNYITSLMLVMLMFMTVYVYGYGVAMSVATEKSTRVMETLIVSAKPTRILLGKCIGMGLVGLIQMVGVLLLAGIGTSIFMPDGIIADGIGLPSLSIGKAVLLVAYFLMGYALFSMINSMCGAMVSKIEDLQSAMMPASLISVLSFYGGYATVGLSAALEGTSSLQGAMMLIPFTAPYAAPSVLLSGNASPALIAASMAILLATIVLVSFISGKVYTASVLHYGSRLRFSDVRKMIRK